ncbi:MAG TPA: family 20 glycosylhydrolase, partial [Ktedonobacteraceae bacterium]|nr:family 20 glycosylhydrolase [Ktedonobacteraceae bacterium]
YTKEQMQALITFAQRYHITIVPEIDMPGHMHAILKHHPDLQLTSNTGTRQPGDIDLSKDESYALMRDILEEFIPLFPGPYWHIGADEYLMFDNYANYPQLQAYAIRRYGPEANSKDTYLGFVNWANALVKAHGRITRAWNDGLHGGSAVTVANDIIYEHWLNSGLTPQEIVDRGLFTMNSSIDYLYYILDGKREQTRPDPIYNAYEQHVFQNKQTIKPGHTQLLGAKLHVWCDHPDAETENQIAEGIAPLLRGLAQKNWGSPKIVPTYTDFVYVMEHIGRAPGSMGQTLPTEQIPYATGEIAVAETTDPPIPAQSAHS